MKEYFFFFNDNDELVCRIETEQEINEYEGQEAITRLYNIDSLPFEHFNATSRMVALNNKRIKVTIADLSEFFQKGYTAYLSNTLDSINKATADYQKRRKKKQAVTNLKVQGSRVLAGGLVLAMLGGAYYHLSKKHTNDKNNDNQDGIEQDYSVEPIKIETDNANSYDIDSMLAELEENNENLTYYDISDGPINTPYLTYENKDDETLDFIDSTTDYSINVSYLDVEDKTNSEKFEHAYNGYHDTVKEYSDRFGNSDNVMMAMLTQETGGYTKDAIMQIEFDAWKTQEIKTYDFEQGCYQKYVIDNDVEKYAEKNIIVITEEDLKNPEVSILAANIIIRYCLEKMHYNIPAAIQMYNLGYGNMMYKVLPETSKQTGLSIDELLSDQTNLEFMKYTHIAKCGDPEYINHITWYLENSEDIAFKVIDENGEISEISTSFVRGSKSL